MTKTDSLENLTHAYTYDNLDRLNAVNGSGAFTYNQTYAYDPIGNITCKSDVGSYTYNYGSQPHAVTQAGNIRLQYDTNGNMTQRAVSGGNTLGFTYNQDNMTTGITQNGSSYIAFTYDEMGQRIRKQNLFTGSTVLYFGDAYEVRNNVGVIHLFAGSQRVVSIRTDGYQPWYLADHLGSASIVTDGNGNIQEKINYFPFGTVRERSDYSTSFPSVNYTFTDQESDDDTGLYNYKSRLYDPVLGRFLSADSIIPDPGNLQSYNRYSYCLNNPLIYVDPSGHFSFSRLFKSIVSAVVGAVVAVATVAAIVATGGAALIPLAMVVGGAAGGAAAAATYTALSGGSLSDVIHAAGQGALMGAAAGAIVAGGYLLGPLVGLTAPIGAAIAGGGVLVGGGIQAYNKGGLEGLIDYSAGAIAGAYAGAYTYDQIYGTSGNAPSTSETQQQDQAAQAKTISSLSTDQGGSVSPANGQNAVGVDQYGNPVDTSMMTAGNNNMAPAPQGTPASGVAVMAARATLIGSGAGLIGLGFEVIEAGAPFGPVNFVTIPVGLFIAGFGVFTTYLGVRPVGVNNGN